MRVADYRLSLHSNLYAIHVLRQLEKFQTQQEGPVRLAKQQQCEQIVEPTPSTTHSKEYELSMALFGLP